MQLKFVKPYTTVGTESIRVIAGEIPIELLVQELVSGKADQAKKRAETIEKWQRTWNVQESRWTRKIPNIKDWLNRNHGEVDFHLTQVLCGHGGYLKRIGKMADNECWYCENGSLNDAHHILYVCKKWDSKEEV